PRIDPQVSSDPSDRLARLPHDPNRSLTERPIEPTSLLQHGAPYSPCLHDLGGTSLLFRGRVSHDPAALRPWCIEGRGYLMWLPRPASADTGVGSTLSDVLWPWTLATSNVSMEVPCKLPNRWPFVVVTIPS